MEGARRRWYCTESGLLWGTGEASPTPATRLGSTLGCSTSLWKAGFCFAWMLAVSFSFLLCVRPYFLFYEGPVAPF